jgi:hypothetical protein
VDKRRAESELLAPLAEPREIGGVVLREAPGARALDEELHRVGADLGRPLERTLDPARAMGSDDHRSTSGFGSAEAMTTSIG